MYGNQLNQNNPTIGNKVHSCGLGGYPTVAIQVNNDLTAGSFVPEASIDGTSFYPIRIFDALGNSVTAITLGGLYRANVSGYQLFQLRPDSSFSGANVVVTSCYGPMTAT